MHSSIMGGCLLVRLTQQGAHPNGVPVGKATNEATMHARNTASPEDPETSTGTL